MKRLLRAAAFSWRGITAAWRDEPAFRQEICAAILLSALAFWLDIGGGARALLIGAVLLVPLVELLNTALEAAVDLVSEERSPLAAKAKDCGSAAVFFAVVLAAAVWGTALWPN